MGHHGSHDCPLSPTLLGLFLLGFMVTVTQVRCAPMSGMQLGCGQWLAYADDALVITFRPCRTVLHFFALALVTKLGLG